MHVCVVCWGEIVGRGPVGGTCEKGLVPPRQRLVWCFFGPQLWRTLSYLVHPTESSAGATQGQPPSLI